MILALVTAASLAIATVSAPQTNGATNSVAAGGCRYTESHLIEGLNYDVLRSPPSAEALSQKIEVLEFFEYSCERCVDLEPRLSKWSSSLPADVSVERVPVGWDRASSRAYARFHYTLKELARADLHGVYFQEVNRALLRRMPLLDSFDEQRRFAKRHGISNRKFRAAYESAAVMRAVERAISLTSEYDVRAAPTMIFGGRYQSDSKRLAGGSIELMLIATDLVEKVRSEQRVAAAHGGPNGSALSSQSGTR
jgi:protein dithiol oxidoreductase (disulfide-forming)